jgi:hypothetical protein
MIITDDIPKKPGIYKITNISNNKCYIGSSVNVYKRIRRHFYELNKNIHSNKYLQKAFNKYSNLNFKIEIVETFENIKYNDLLNIEKNYILKYNSIETGYNLILDNSEYFKTLNKTKDHISKNIKKTSIKVFSFDRFTGNFEKEFNSVSEASRYYKTSSSNISRVCKGSLNYIKDKVFCYKKDFDKNKSYKKEHEWNKNIIFSKEHLEKISHSVSKSKGRKIYQYDLNFNLIKIYYSRSNAEKENNFKKEYLKNRAGLKTPFGGYYWLYTKI